MRRILQKADLNFAELQEIRMRINSPLMIRQRGKEYKLTEEGKLLRCNGNEQYEKENIHYVDRCELMETMEYIAGYSLYAYEDELRQGFLTIQGGHRVGVAGKILMEEGKVRSIRYISFLNIRLAHQVEGCADKVMPFIVENGEVCHTLIISPPNVTIRYCPAMISRATVRKLLLSLRLANAERSSINAFALNIFQN